jgi:hypothetical protein
MAGYQLGSSRHPHPSFAQPVLQGRSVAAVRALFGLTAEDVAAATGISAFSLSRLENGHRRPSANEIGRLLVAVGGLVVPPRVPDR